MKNFLLSWGLVFFSALFDSYAAFIVKRKFNQLGSIDFTSFHSFVKYISIFIKDPVLLTAVFTFVTAPALWFFALNRLHLSVAYPVLIALHLLFILFFGVFFLGELMTAKKMIGIALVVLSLFFFYK